MPGLERVSPPIMAYRPGDEESTGIALFYSVLNTQSLLVLGSVASAIG